MQQLSQVLGRSQNQTLLAIMRSYSLEYGTLKSDFDSDQGIPYEPHCVHYVNRFYSLYYCHHYDHCFENIANIICRPGACISLKEYGFCLFICLIAGSEYVDKSKPIFLLLKLFL